MGKNDTLTNYGTSASDYDCMRQPGPETVRLLHKVFSSVPHGGVVLSLGCGTGQYEQVLWDGKGVVGLDKSWEMLAFARKRVELCVQANMRDLPFANDTFDGICFVQSLHHVAANFSISPRERDEARKTALGEAIRVLREGPLVIVQRDPSQNEAAWFWKYFPEALAAKLIIQTPIGTLVEWLAELGLHKIRAVPVDDPMIKGFYDPKAPLDPAFRRAFSPFSYLTAEQVSAGLERLQDAIYARSVAEQIEASKRRFGEIGGTVFVVRGYKSR